VFRVWLCGCLLCDLCLWREPTVVMLRRGGGLDTVDLVCHVDAHIGSGCVVES
jgi:hypothetical protein